LGDKAVRAGFVVAGVTEPPGRGENLFVEDREERGENFIAEAPLGPDRWVAGLECWTTASSAARTTPIPHTPFGSATGPKMMTVPSQMFVPIWTCLEKVERFPWMKGEFDDEAEGIYARV
jgi:hypothetical protein